MSVLPRRSGRIDYFVRLLHMSIKILYTDLRTVPSKLEKHVLEWERDLTAFHALERTLGRLVAETIDKDLKNDNHELMVSWYNKDTGDICEIGGVGRLDWYVQDSMLLTVNYENESTSQQQIEEADNWTLEQGL